MSMSSASTSEWTYEGDDTSVGIFGHEWIHEGCADTHDGEGETAEYEVGGVRTSPDTVIFFTRIACLDCGAVVTAAEAGWCPSAAREAEMVLAEEEAERWANEEECV